MTQSSGRQKPSALPPDDGALSLNQPVSSPSYTDRSLSKPQDEHKGWTHHADPPRSVIHSSSSSSSSSSASSASASPAPPSAAYTMALHPPSSLPATAYRLHVQTQPAYHTSDTEQESEEEEDEDEDDGRMDDDSPDYSPRDGRVLTFADEHGAKLCAVFVYDPNLIQCPPSPRVERTEGAAAVDKRKDREKPARVERTPDAEANCQCSVM